MKLCLETKSMPFVFFTHAVYPTINCYNKRLLGKRFDLFLVQIFPKMFARNRFFFQSYFIITCINNSSPSVYACFVVACHNLGKNTFSHHWTSLEYHLTLLACRNDFFPPSSWRNARVNKALAGGRKFSLYFFSLRQSVSCVYTSLFKAATHPTTFDFWFIFN